MKRLLGAASAAWLGCAGFVVPTGVVPVPPPAPILDTITPDAGSCAYSAAWKLSSAYAGNAIELQNTQSSVTHTQNIGFVGTLVDGASADSFDALADSGTLSGVKISYDQAGNSRNTASPASLMTWLRHAARTDVPVAMTEPFSDPRAMVNDHLASYSNQNQYQTIPSGCTGSNDTLTIGVLARTSTSFPDHLTALLALGATAATSIQATFDATNGFAVTFGALNGGAGQTFAFTTKAVESGPTWYLITVSASQVCADVGGVSLGCLSKGTVGGTVAGGFIGACASCAGGGGSDIYAALLWFHSFSGGEVASFDAWASYVLGHPDQTSRRYIEVGDSTSEQAYAASNRNHQVATQILLNHPTRAYNDATDGITCATLDANFAAHDAPNIAAGDLVVIHCGTNDSVQSCALNSTCAAWDHIQSMVNKAHAAASGVKVIVEDIYAGALNYSVFNTAIESDGTAAQGSGAPFGDGGLGADAVVKTWTDPATQASIGSTETPAAGTGLLTDCYPEDTIHPGYACNIKAAVVDAAVINGIYP